jgi:predicted sugar kinase
METLEETLCERVDEAIESHKGLLLSTTGPVAAIGELVTRVEGLEEAIREIALEVQRLADSQKGGAPTRDLERVTGR